MASKRADYLVEIVEREIPTSVGGRMYAGFVTLSNCNGRTYQAFRDQAGGPKGNVSRRFSPPSVIKLAEQIGFARLVPSSSTLSSQTLIQETASNSSVSSQSIGNSLPFSKANGLLGRAATVEIKEGVTIDRPGIYPWEIQDAGAYVGRYTNPSQPLGEYDKNVSRILRGEGI